MSRFNQKAVNPRDTINHEGAKAYGMLNPEMELYARTASYLAQDTNYCKVADANARIKELVGICDKNFVGRLAGYLRHQMYLRSTPILLLTYLAQCGKLEAWMVQDVISRADEIKELLAAWQQETGRRDLKKLPKAMQNGIAKAFGKFNAFQFRKYNKQGREEITFLDAMRITHPKPMNEEQNTTYKAIKEGNLPPIETWETVLSSGMNKREAWELLIKGHKLPYMALLRNLVNISKADVDNVYIDMVVNQLTNKDEILRSKQFPFRWTAAHDQLELMGGNQFITTAFQRALEEALKTSVQNIAGLNLKQNTIIACDVSGSMRNPLSVKSKIQLVDVGLLMGKLISAHNPRSLYGVFGDIWMPVHSGSSVLEKAYYDPHQIGFSTQGHKVIDWAADNNIKAEVFMFFSDMEIYSLSDKDFFRSTSRLYLPITNTVTWDERRASFRKSWNNYKKLMPNAKCYLFDLSSYGSTPVDVQRDDVIFSSGFSEKIFEVLDGTGNWNETRTKIMMGASKVREEEMAA
jgi:hypothetical protein